MYNNIEESGVKRVKIGEDTLVECEFDTNCSECKLNASMKWLRGCPSSQDEE